MNTVQMFLVTNMLVTTAMRDQRSDSNSTDHTDKTCTDCSLRFAANKAANIHRSLKAHLD